MTHSDWISTWTIIIPLVVGFGAWMFRIDRALTRMGFISRDIVELKKTTKEHGKEIDGLDIRVTRIESQR